MILKPVHFVQPVNQEKGVQDSYQWAVEEVRLLFSVQETVGVVIGDGTVDKDVGRDGPDDVVSLAGSVCGGSTGVLVQE